MNFLDKYKTQILVRFVLSIYLICGIFVSSWFVGYEIIELSGWITLIISFALSLPFTVVAAYFLTQLTSSPLHKLQEIVSFIGHDDRGGTPPDIDNIYIGRELITAMSKELYALAGTNENSHKEEKELSSFPQQILDSFHIPMLGVDNDQNITMINRSALEYINKELQDVIGKPLYDSLSLSFQGDETLEEWLATVRKSSVTSSRSWEKVHHSINGEGNKQFDLSASFSNQSANGTDTMLALFDKTEQYNSVDNEFGYVALAVHELRTPLTVMRGYIEVFEDELGPTLNPELVDFMHKMHASAQQLTAFVSNILNVARIEENQLSLKLHKENLEEVLKRAIEDLTLRANVYDKKIQLTVQPDIPPVAVARTSLHEVINNLVDNAIKYSGASEVIEINAGVNKEGIVEVSVKDNGIGIPRNVVTELFQKFHRSHKSKNNVGGTGLGLYLCKALINAMGGNIWVNSKEGQGATFSFTLLPYDQITKEQKAGEDGIIRGAHGWIKNHSMYRS